MEWLDVLKETAEEAQIEDKDRKKNKKKQQTDGTKHPWSKQEDELLKKLIQKHGPSDWSDLAKGVSTISVSIIRAAFMRVVLTCYDNAVCRSKVVRANSAANDGRISWTQPCAKVPGQRRRTRS